MGEDTDDIIYYFYDICPLYYTTQTPSGGNLLRMNIGIKTSFVMALHGWPTWAGDRQRPRGVSETPDESPH